jgi:hypothetical protein
MKMSKGKLVTPTNFWGRGFYVDSSLGVYPRFQLEIRGRVKQKRATNVTLTGEGGIGKTYMAIQICRLLSRRFTIDQVVFGYYDFLKAVLRTRMGVPIVFDEPSYAMSKRDWYKQINQALVKTIESFRFKVHPLFIPIINKSLLDKTVRSYLLQFHIHIQDRGKAQVYRLSPSQFEDKTYQYNFCKLDYPLFDRHLCNKESCLGCEYLFNQEQTCQIMRAQYERKKDETQEERCEQDLIEAKRKEGKRYTNAQIAEIALPFLDQFLKSEKKISVPKLKALLELDHSIVVGANRCYDIVAVIERRMSW